MILQKKSLLSDKPQDLTRLRYAGTAVTLQVVLVTRVLGGWFFTGL